jgi:hypothetical protein
MVQYQIIFYQCLSATTVINPQFLFSQLTAHRQGARRDADLQKLLIRRHRKTNKEYNQVRHNFLLVPHQMLMQATYIWHTPPIYGQLTLSHYHLPNRTERTDSGSSYLTPKDKIIRHKNTRDVKIKNWASSVRDSILMYNDDTSTPPHAVLIGQTADPPTKLCAKHTHYAIDHWAALVDVEYQSIAQQDKLSFIVMSIPQPNGPRYAVCVSSLWHTQH